MSSIQPTLSTVVDLKPTFGWIFIGVVCAAVFYGITVLQTLFYFQTYPSDTIFLKSLVTGIWILDTLSLILVAYATYTWLIIDYANPLALNNIIWSIAAEPLCTTNVALSVHLFMAYRIYILKPKLILLSIAIAVVSFVPCGVGLAAVIISLTTPGGFAAVNLRLHALAILAGVFSAVLDGTIAVTLVTLLYLHGQGAPKLTRTNRMISTLTIYLVTNNLLTSFLTITGAIVFFASPKTLVYLAINVVISKAYTNTFLSQLNVRESIRGKGAIVTQVGPASGVKNTKLGGFNYGSSRYRTDDISAFEAADPRAIQVSVTQSEITSFPRSSVSDDTGQTYSAGGIIDNEKPSLTE